jgi:hypothetical protein
VLIAPLSNQFSRAAVHKERIGGEGQVQAPVYDLGLLFAVHPLGGGAESCQAVTIERLFS